MGSFFTRLTCSHPHWAAHSAQLDIQNTASIQMSISSPPTHGPTKTPRESGQQRSAATMDCVATPVAQPVKGHPLEMLYLDFAAGRWPSPVAAALIPLVAASSEAEEPPRCGGS